ncbi:receptor-interacting serine/threonine-protein kinase 2-like [Pelodytes ibericus]
MSNNSPEVRHLNMRTCQIVQTSSGLVFRVTYGANYCYGFVKHFPSSGLNEREHQRILEEVKFLRQINSERLAHVIAVYQMDSTFGILSDWMANGSLHSLLYQRDLYPTLPFCVRVRILADVTEGLCHLHSLSPPVIHEALKPCNILLDGKYRAKVSDFGLGPLRTLASISADDSDQKNRVYLSPERLQGAGPSTEDDIYSFGIICWETFSMQPPFHASDNGYPLKLETYITRGFRPQPDMDTMLKTTNMSPTQCSGLVELVNCCWHRDPRRRPSIAMCCTHLQRIQQTFPSDDMDRSVQYLLSEKVKAEKTTQNPPQECDIRFLSFSCSMSNSRPQQRNRAQSTPHEKQAETTESRGQRSASMPCTSTGNSSPTQSSISPAANHMIGICPRQESARQPSPVNWKNGCSNHMPRLEGLRSPSYCPSTPSWSPGLVKSRNFAKMLLANRERILQWLTEGRLNQLLDIMRSSQVFSRDDYENINGNSTLTGRARKCLDICYEKGEEASRVVLATLNSSHFLFVECTYPAGLGRC